MSDEPMEETVPRDVSGFGFEYDQIEVQRAGADLTGNISNRRR
jgi:hypothetical protein